MHGEAMHIGYVLKKFPRISETFILNEVLELERQGARVTVFSLHRPDDGVFHQKLSELGSPVVYLPVRKSPDLLDQLRRRLPVLGERREQLFDEFESLLESQKNDLWSILTWGLEVAFQAQERGVERLHAHFATVATYAARAAHAFTGIPYSFTCHAKDIYREGVEPARFQSLAAPADFVVTVCEANKQHILQNLAGNKQLRVLALYNGVDLDTFHPRHRRPDPVPLVLGVGRLVEKKGFRYLISAAAGLIRAGHELRCVIVGEGEERERLEAQIRDAGNENISLAGIRTHDEIRELMNRATMLVLPCIIGEDGNRDALPTVLLEAMANGVPVIASPVAGVEEIVDGGESGVLVPNADASALEKAMADLLGDAGRQEALSRAGRGRAEQCFDLRTNVATLHGCFRSGFSQEDRPVAS